LYIEGDDGKSSPTFEEKRVHPHMKSPGYAYSSQCVDSFAFMYVYFLSTAYVLCYCNTVSWTRYDL